MMWRRSLNKLIRQYLSFIEISKALNLDGSDKLKNKNKRFNLCYKKPTW